MSICEFQAQAYENTLRQELIQKCRNQPTPTQLDWINKTAHTMGQKHYRKLLLEAHNMNRQINSYFGGKQQETPQIVQQYCVPARSEYFEPKIHSQ